MGEEAKDARRSVPKAMMGSIIANGVLGFLMVVTFIVRILPINTSILVPHTALTNIFAGLHATDRRDAILAQPARLYPRTGHRLRHHRDRHRVRHRLHSLQCDYGHVRLYKPSNLGVGS